ncbi:MAG: hypothetical protein HQM14_20475, partial [SAR324 cluster bacterium]|nr:hypothetical protein [SAR324 cluster bacterium]
LPFFLLFLLLGFFFLHPSRLKKRLLHGAVFLIGFLLVMSPWITRGYQIYGTLLLTSTGGWYTFVHQNNDTVEPGEFGGYEYQDYYQTEAVKRFKNDLEASKWVQQGALEWVRSHPRRYFQLCVGRLKMLFVQNGIALTRTHPLELNFLSHSFFYLFHWNVGIYPGTNGGIGWLLLTALLLVLIRFPSQWKTRKIDKLFFQVLPVLYFFSTAGLHLLFTATPRYRAALLPSVFLIIGIGFDPIFSWIRFQWYSIKHKIIA